MSNPVHAASPGSSHAAESPSRPLHVVPTDSLAPVPAASRLSADPLGMIGRTVGGRYGIERLLRRGGMGAVYLARQVALRRPVALKVLTPAAHGAFGSGEAARMLLEEAAAAASLTSPHSVTVYDVGHTDDGRPYIAMEYLNGRSVEDLLDDGGPLALDRALHAAVQICRALREAHASGIVHRDLKPANVMLVDRDNDPEFAVVLDYGLAGHWAVQAACGGQEDGHFVGSPQFAAPEQFRSSRAVDHRADIYSVGLLLFAMLTDRLPARGTPEELIAGHRPAPPPLLRTWRTDAPPELEVVVRCCMDNDPDARYADVTALMRDLGRVRVPGAHPAARISAHDLEEFAQPLVLD